MSNKIGPISLSDIRRFGSEFSSLGQEYILARVEPGDFSSADIISPWRFDGVTIVLMLNASGSVTINLETLEVPRYSIMVIDETMPVNLHCDDVSDMERISTVSLKGLSGKRQYRHQCYRAPSVPSREFTGAETVGRQHRTDSEIPRTTTRQCRNAR